MRIEISIIISILAILLSICNIIYNLKRDKKALQDIINSIKIFIRGEFECFFCEQLKHKKESIKKNSVRYCKECYKKIYG